MNQFINTLVIITIYNPDDFSYGFLINHIQALIPYRSALHLAWEYNGSLTIVSAANTRGFLTKKVKLSNLVIQVRSAVVSPFVVSEFHSKIKGYSVG